MQPKQDKTEWNDLLLAFCTGTVCSSLRFLIKTVPNSTGQKQMLKGGISQLGNKVSFKMFNLIGSDEHAGSDVPDIYNVWSAAGLDAPVGDEIFGRENPDRTILTLPLKSSAFILGID